MNEITWILIGLGILIASSGHYDAQNVKKRNLGAIQRQAEQLYREGFLKGLYDAKIDGRVRNGRIDT